ncbi:MAG TPA: hypothetical protein PK385_07540 [Spirochaetota bacterium]|nr:hypothetical protein [Spirochaetota bacterium]HOS32442.1 hypothetical protein [Spirochaetota bacterium]HOS55895.1 hypothetical protein [Spirochaetota bacterium]HPK61261.1 hypothetical protein [Spirochaetota bacterium]HQF77477.1 hypothetical protein [Spirochaetota bacterium]
MLTIDKVFSDIDSLTIEDMEQIEYELKNRIIEKKRDNILNLSKQINMEIQNGDFKKGSVDEFLEDLDS